VSGIANLARIDGFRHGPSKKGVNALRAHPILRPHPRFSHAPNRSTASRACAVAPA
jgi:hypothetical protein